MALEAGRSWKSGRVIAYDINPSVVSALTAARQSSGLATDATYSSMNLPGLGSMSLSPTPLGISMSFARSLWFCHAMCRTGGFILASIPPLGTRPGIAEERAKLIEFSSRLGLELIRIKPARASVPVAPVRAKCSTCRRDRRCSGRLAAWGLGDLRETIHFQLPQATVSSPVDADWCDVSFSAARLEGQFQDGARVFQTRGYRRSSKAMCFRP